MQSLGAMKSCLAHTGFCFILILSFSMLVMATIPLIRNFVSFSASFSRSKLRCHLFLLELTCLRVMVMIRCCPGQLSKFYNFMLAIHINLTFAKVPHPRGGSKKDWSVQLGCRQGIAPRSFSRFIEVDSIYRGYSSSLLP
jgi:hypothetical protein